MAFLVGGANSASGAYEISNSLRFNPGDNAYLNKTPGSEGNKRTYTLSFWAKICPNYGTDTSTNNFYTARNSGGFTSGIHQISGGYIQAFIYDDTGGEEYKLQLVTNAAYRDVSAWYHFVLAVDTTQGTAGNRAKFYVNGTQVTSFSTETYPDQNFDSHINDDVPHYMGNKDGTNDDYDGYLSEFYLIDGTQYAASNFGETDDNGVWIPKEAKGDLTFGTNGFFMEFKQTGTSANSSGKGADTSGQDNHYDDNNMTAEDITTDTPTNNFATLNPLSDLNATLSEGNTQLVRNASSAVAAVATIAPANGKWYYEFQLSASNNASAGVVDVDKWDSTTDVYDYDDSGAVAVLIESSDNFIVDYTEATAGGTRLQNSVDLNTAKYGFAVDLDNQGFYASANGNWYTGSAFDDTDFSNATNLANDIPAGTPMAFFARGSIASASYANFGNPGGADSISSGNADANGYGNFEYAVPSGYYALCTKNLAEYG